MSGYLTTERDRSVNEKLNWNVRHGGIVNPSRLSVPRVQTEYLTTFRSGDRYQSEINGGATRVIGTSLLDRAGRALGDTGHNFDHRMVKQGTSMPRALLSANGWLYEGPMLFDVVDRYSTPNPMLTSNLGFSDGALDVMGTSAIAKVYPTKPHADLMVAIAELLREGLPSALFSAVTMTGGNSGRQLVRDLSSDYLNLLFGVTPIVREIDRLITTVQRMDQHVAQLVRDSGRAVRRTRTITDVQKTRGPWKQDMDPNLLMANGTFGLNAMCGRIPAVVTETSSEKTWFSGSFRYWVPGLQSSSNGDSSFAPGDFLSQADLRLQILGLRATPKAAWNLLPFSWLVDWFVNVSDLFEVAHAMTNYGLVMPYGYVMSETKRITTTTYDFRNTSLSKLGSVTSNVVAIRQQRRRATPYGFGLKDVDLNPIQWSIMGALAGTTGKRA